MKDLDQLYSELGMADKPADDVMHSVCDPELPDAGEIWGGVVEKSGEWLDQARAAMYVFNIPMTEIESEAQPDGIGNDIGWEAVAIVDIHTPIVSNQKSLFVSTP